MISSVEHRGSISLTVRILIGTQGERGCRTLWFARVRILNLLDLESMRNPLQRYYGRGDLHFTTFSCYRRQPLLGTVHARGHFVQVLDAVRTRHRFRLVGYVVMPEHVHLLISEPESGNPSKVLQVLKQKASRILHDQRKASPRALISPRYSLADSPDSFWQRRFYDFNVWSAKKVTEKLRYMHRNPVSRKLVAHPKDWPWSSWSHCETQEQGVIWIDTLWKTSLQNRRLQMRLNKVKIRTLEIEGCGTLKHPRRVKRCRHPSLKPSRRTKCATRPHSVRK